jgi:membrane protein YdbS with pleckstrin-like domain
MEGKVYRPDLARGAIVKGGAFSLVTLFLGSNFIFASVFLGPFAGIAIILAGILLLSAPIVLMYYYLKFQWYEFKEDGIMVNSGIIAKSHALILYSQIQDVQEHQGFVEGIFGLSNIIVISMTQMSKPIRLIALDTKEANEIKNLLLNASKRHAKESRESANIVTISGPEKVSDEPLYSIHTVKKALTVFAIVAPFLLLLAAAYYSLAGRIAFIVSLVSSAVILTVIFVFMFVGSIITQVSFRLQLNRDSITIGREFLSRYFTNLPFYKVQDIGMTNGVFDRLLGMAGLTIETGEAPLYEGKHQMNLNSMRDLYAKDALKLRETVLKKSGIKNLNVESLRDNFPLEAIKPLKKSISETFWLFVILGVAVTVLYPLLPTYQSYLLFALAVPAILFPIKYVYEYFYYRSYSYGDNQEMLVLRKGVFTKREVTVPYKKMQNIFVNQDIFDKLFGLYDVHVSTVGLISQMQLHIDGVSKKNADSLKVLFKHRIS